MGLRAKTVNSASNAGTAKTLMNGNSCAVSSYIAAAAAAAAAGNIGCNAKPTAKNGNGNTAATPASTAFLKYGNNAAMTADTTSTSGSNSNNNNNNSKSNENYNKAISSAEMETTCITTTTYRSSSTSAIVAAAAAANYNMRPQTLNVHHLRETLANHTEFYFRDLLHAWRAKARCNVVPSERTQELFHELNFNPSEKQISEMLQTAKMLACKGSRQPNGLTFGEFCVLAADLKRFRTSSFSTNNFCDNGQSLHNSTTHEQDSNGTAPHTILKEVNCSDYTAGSALRSTKSLSHVEDCQKRKLSKQSGDPTSPVEVFLGGSCNPTTWRADVAIPALKELGISFYNPQVSDWTPDLIELEHRAKEKARVLFFVMDSETRASAGAIEAAHIAGQNCKQLVLVLHPYQQNQNILNEPISRQEYIDLRRNQLILEELVKRRGLSVLDNIPSGLQRTKEILAGIRDPPSNIASILVVVRGAFDRVNPVNDVITVDQCQRALSYLGYAHSLIKLDNLEKIIATQRQSFDALKQQCSSSTNKTSSKGAANVQNRGNSCLNTCDCKNATNTTTTSTTTKSTKAVADCIDFDLFCVISAYLSVLQQEIQESGCISPIKGTNVPPPPIYLTNMTNMQGDLSYFTSKNISRTSSNVSVPSSNGSSDERQSLNDLLCRSRDSGTSSPQPLEQALRTRLLGKQKTQILVNVESIETTEITTTQTMHATTPKPAPSTHIPVAYNSVDSNASAEDPESDSNDSVFSSSSSINSVNYNHNEALTYSTEFRDIYLGGSCALRSKWREELAVPYLKSKKISFHLPALHESIPPGDMNWQQKGTEDAAAAHTLDAQERSFVRTRRKCRVAQLEEEEITTTLSEESFSWALSPIRSNLYNPNLLDSSRVLLFVITNETRSLAPMTLAAHCIGLMYNVVLAVQMLPEDCVIGHEKLTPAAIKDYNRGRSYLIDLAKRQGVPVFNDLKAALACAVDKVKSCNSRTNIDV